MNSIGSLSTGDERIVKASEETPGDHILQIMAGVRYKTRVTSSLIIVAVIVVKCSDK